MNQQERRLYLLNYLLNEDKQYSSIKVPKNTNDQKTLLRALFNVRMPKETTKEFIEIQDEYLKQANIEKGIVDYKTLTPICDDIYLWQGDISSLKIGAIVNAANSQMLGCFQPNHSCIDNCIHTFAGIQLRQDCQKLMVQQGYPEPTGKAKITSAYNLPADYVIHTVGPIVQNKLTKEHEQLLESSYRACLEIADENNVGSIAFCCISTGVFNFPNEAAAKIAIDTVKKYKNETGSKIEVVFNVFKEKDLQIYKQLLR